jgi:putative metalloenzyme radical SAM/SPASM domain maturase
MSMATFMALAPAFPFLESLVLSGIGEPLLHPNLDDFITAAKTLMPKESWVGFQSNGALLTKKRAESLIAAGLGRISLSVDSLCSDTFRQIREGGELANVEDALSFLSSAKLSARRSEVEIGIEFVVRRDNVRELPEVLRWAASHGASFAIVSHLLPYDTAHLPLIAYEYNSDEALALFESWERRALAEGMDLNRYYDLLCKHTLFRTAEEKRLLDFGFEIMLDFFRQGVFFPLKNLVSRDDSLREEVAQTFEAAKATANEIGLRLTLPEITPKADRNCPFIESGSVMVSWDGRIHPCYYLWHDCYCHFKGRDASRNNVSKSFGSVDQRNNLEIWNDPAFRSFRCEVLKYDFSACSDCSVVPCNLLNDPDFSNDCQSSTVPCGDCFWCMGLFNCLQ